MKIIETVRSIPFCMKHEELRVTGTGAQDSLTPTSGKKIRVFGLQISGTVTSALTSTLRASISFGTNGITNTSKVLWSNRELKANEVTNLWIGNINVMGAVDETVTLTNVTYSSGTSILRTVVYYIEE